MLWADTLTAMRITALAGGVGGARFLRGLHAHLDRTPDLADSTVTVIGNTGDDISLFGLRVCPDLDTILYTLGGGVHEGQGWGRADETHRVQGELAAYGALPQWFALGDQDFGTHIVRSQWLGQGLSLSEVTARLAERWGLPGRGITLLPMTDSPVETHVVVDEGEGPRAVHFQEWWVRMQAAVPASRFVAVGMDRATAAPGVLDAIRQADVVLLPPSNPVVSIGIILGVPGVRDALRGTTAPVVGVSPLISGAPVRGHADACLQAIGLESTTTAVAGLYADFLDGWLVSPGDADHFTGTGRLAVRGRPLLMTDVGAAADIAGAALDLAAELRRTPA
jgi:LPPG:FO 2-phospho-L-lactate transferase